MQAPHPTKEALINAVLELLSAEHLNEITSEEVLHKSGISKGSLYHHFEDFSDLLETAEVRRFSLVADATIAWLTDSLRETEKDKFLEQLESFNEVTFGNEYKKQRLIRVKAVAHAGLTDRMKERLNLEQERLTGAIADMCQEMQFRGWMSTKYQPKTLAVFFQAYTTGLIINDYVDHPAEESDWLLLLSAILKDVILATN